MTRPFVVVSSGGCGSKFLVRMICDHISSADYERHHSHERYPSTQFVTGHDRVVVLFSDPVDAVISFFSRRLRKTGLHGYDGRTGQGTTSWAVSHCQNIGGRHTALDPAWGLADFLHGGKDLFELETHLRNWLGYTGTGELLFLRYDAMWAHPATIARYMGFGESFVRGFGARLPRGSQLSELDPALQRRALELYGSARALVDSLDDVFLLADGKIRLI